jgi:tRNA threonylcarbamoyladenosine biosynthesis protein TsaB
MKILVINTAASIIDIALYSDGVIFGIERHVRLNEYEDVVSLIASLLKKQKLGFEQIDYFGVCLGPGSFTGIRIGLSAMKAIAYSARKPLVGFKSLDLLAWTARGSFRGTLCVIQDAKRSNFYSAVFYNNGKIKRASQYLLLSFPQLMEEIKDLNKKNVQLYFYGEMAVNHKDDIIRIFPAAKLLQDGNVSLRRKAMIELTKANIAGKTDAFSIMPFYMYPRDCQVRKQ